MISTNTKEAKAKQKNHLALGCNKNNFNFGQLKRPVFFSYNL